MLYYIVWVIGFESRVKKIDFSFVLPIWPIVRYSSEYVGRWVTCIFFSDRKLVVVWHSRTENLIKGGFFSESAIRFFKKKCQKMSKTKNLPLT